MSAPAEARLSSRRVLRFALPVVISNATVPLLGMVDTGVVGHLGSAAPIGAVGVGSVILSSLYWIFGFLRMGTTGLTANAVGAGNRAEVAALLTRGLLIGLSAGILLILLQGPLFALAFHVTPASGQVEAMARQYMGIRILSAPAAIGLYAVNGWLIAQERTRGILIIQLAMNAVNISLDLVFVIGFGWGVGGVAAASFLSEWGGLAMGLWICRRAFRDPAWRDWPRVFDRERLVHMALINRDILLRSLMLQAVVVSFTMFGARLGDTVLAANQVLLQFMMITSFALDGFAFAAEAMVGAAAGRGDREGLRRAAFLSGGWAFAISAGLALVFALAGGLIIAAMTSAPDVRETALHFLPWIVAAPLAGVWPFILDGVFIGATRAGDMRNMMALSVLAYGVAVAVLLPAFGNAGLWASYLICFLARGVTLALRYPALEAGVSRG